jgi:hypothetical protein
LFSKLGPGDTVENVGIANENIYVSVGSGSDYIGGLIGENSGTVLNSFSTGSITYADNTLGNNYIGGLAGYNNGGSISNSYSEVAITDADGSYSPNSVGGFLGYNSGSVSNSYSVGAVTDNTAGDRVGGFAGTDDSGTYNSDYYDKDTSGQSNACGSGACSGITALTDPQMKEPFNFIAWDIDPSYEGGPSAYTWYQSPGYSYPLLVSTNTAGTPAEVDGITYTLVNASNIDEIDSMGDSNNYALMYNINLGGNANFTPIGESAPFTGIFNGWGACHRQPYDKYLHFNI